mgnify:CR=1 FL=1
MLGSIANFTSHGLSLNLFGILLALIALETILSADNAVALAVIAQDMPDPIQQRYALNWGLLIAFLLRIGLLLLASWIIQFWQFELAGALYLLWLVGRHFWGRLFTPTTKDEESSRSPTTLWKMIPLIALTDLAFSIDSVTTAVALSNQIGLILTGCLIGIVMLRVMAGVFVQLLATFTYLQDAAYLTVLGVGLRLLLKALLPDYLPPDWTVLIMMASLFVWGFSKRVTPEMQQDG